jgi:hypothetical protein
MNKSIAIKTAALIAACGLVMISTTASADSRVHWSVNVGVPVYSPPPVVYYNPPPVYVQPQPVYVQPHPVYAQPQPVYVAPPPVVVYYDAWGRPHYRHHHRHHGWR